MRFRKKPVEIEAVRFTADVGNHMRMAAFTKQECEVEEHRDGWVLTVETLNGPVMAKEGEWIIKGTKGEIYPCRDDIFRETYEPID